MRVIAGSAKRLLLKCPEGINTRPTTDRIKETLFNMLQPYLYDGVFMDLFSGSGGIGIEALSRGARRVYFVENDSKALNCIKENLAATHLEEKAIIKKQDVLSTLMSMNSEERVDVIFADPPYDSGLEMKLLKQLLEADFVTEDTLIVIEASLKTDLSDIETVGFKIEKEKRYKTNKHFFIRRNV